MVGKNVALIALLVIGARARPFGIPANETLEDLHGSTRECVNGKVHELTYKTRGLGSNKVQQLESLHDIEDVSCDLDHTNLRLEFKNDAIAAEYYLKFHDWNWYFLTGGDKWNCSQLVGPRSGSFILRRVVGAKQSNHYLEVSTTPARYDEVYETAEISFSSSGSCSSNDEVDTSGDKPICLGYNTDCHSGTASQALPLYSNKYLDIECSDCFFDFQADVFVDVSISDWKVQKLQGGFRNVALNASIVFDAKAAEHWSTAMDKTLKLIATTYLLNFKIGVIPFSLFFDIPVEVKADLSFNTAADATIGAKANLAIGDAYLQWDPTNHWTSAKPTPKFSFTPVLATSANLDAQGDFSLTPTFTMHFDRVFKYQMVFNPSVTAQISGSETSEQICMDSAYDAALTQQVDLDINIPWANIDKDYTYGPTTIWSVTGQPMAKKCLNV